VKPENFEDSEAPLLPSLEDLVVPRRPIGVTYATGDDYDAEALLKANGISLEADQLIALLVVDFGIFQAAAARVLGARNERAAIEQLHMLAADDFFEETARVQASYALSRMGQIAGHGQLVEILNYPVEASPAPLQAAAALATLGDPQGFSLVRDTLDSSSTLNAMVACKQLYAFVPLHGYPLAEGNQVDVYRAYSRALLRKEPNITGEALAQLEELNSPEARALISGR